MTEKVRVIINGEEYMTPRVAATCMSHRKDTMGGVEWTPVGTIWKIKTTKRIDHLNPLADVRFQIVDLSPVRTGQVVYCHEKEIGIFTNADGKRLALVEAR